MHLVKNRIHDIQKPVRVYRNGKRQKNIYLAGTLKARFIKEVRFWLRVIIIATAIYGIASAYNWVNAPLSAKADSYAEKTTQAQIDTLKAKIESLKWEVVDTINTCEKHIYDEDDGLITFDPLVSNPAKTAKKNVPSIGTLQWKQSTIQGYMKSIHGKDITMKEAALIALDDKQARQLAYDVIFTTDKGYRNWLNCSTKHNIADKVELIKQLEK